jgi:pentatricopeptide repeat protein
LIILSYLGFVVNSLAQEAIELFSTIKNPDEINVVLLLNSCAQVGTSQSLDIGRQVLAKMPVVYHRNKYILNSALDMFVRSGDVCSAENWFSKMKCDAIHYGQMMKCFNNGKLPLKTVNLFETMKSEGVKPSVVTYLLLIDACSQLGMEALCQSIVEQIPADVLVNVQIESALIDMWVRRAKETLFIDYSSYSTSIKGKAGDVDQAESLFQKIRSPDIVTLTAMGEFATHL